MHSIDVRGMLEQIVRAVVHDPDQVQVRALHGEQSSLIEIRVAPDDTGLLIGRGGNTIRAIRHLAHVIGARDGQRIEVSILNRPQGGPPRDR